jgi:hypothetical protein
VSTGPGKNQKRRTALRNELATSDGHHRRMSDRVVAAPRNDLKLQNPSPSGWGFRFERDRQDSSQIASDVDLQIPALGREDDLLDEGTQNLACFQPRCLRISLQRLVQSTDLFWIEGCHLGVQQGWRLPRVNQYSFELGLPALKLNHLCVDFISSTTFEDQVQQRRFRRTGAHFGVARKLARFGLIGS